ncbi:unnamed protein product [Danaus chrysippus]|uniref:(African queen) hypothetical protein n=1 Tax=Danaus chrysippus TaxID=151541 RepID=A0A8J2QTB5_9NEOP|nr:unnamed protein product [Danaus chrysippus]
MIDRLHPKQENTQKTQSETADCPRHTRRNVLLYVITVYKTLRVDIRTDLTVWSYVYKLYKTGHLKLKTNACGRSQVFKPPSDD